MNEPPQDLAAEQGVLGAMFLSADAISSVLPILSADSFYRPAHGYIFDAVRTLFTKGEPVDPVTVAAELESQGNLNRIGGKPAVLTIYQAAPTAANASYYAKIIQEKARLRQMAQLGQKLQQLAYAEGHDSDELIHEAEKYFRSVQEPPKGALTFEQLVTDWRLWTDSPDDIIETPWPELNTYLGGGLRKGKVYILGGRPAAGKSLSALNIASHTAERGGRALIFSMEMKQNEVASRLLAGGAWADYGQIFRKSMDAENWHRIEEYVDRQSEMNLAVIDQSNITAEEISAQIRVHKPDIAVIDYMQLISVKGNASRREQVDHVSRTLKIAAGENNVAMVIASQLNRDSTKGGGRMPTIADLRESGGQEADADVVLLLSRSESDPGIVRMGVGKNRDGKLGTIDLAFRGKYARIG